MLAALLAIAVARPSAGPVDVYVLAGQSNMEGHAKVALMDVQAGQEIYKPYRDGAKWRTFGNVLVDFFDRKGLLTVGFGSPGCIGPELGFGSVMGGRTHASVLLIKTAWGGKSLWRDFRPPSAGLPGQEVLDKLLANEQKGRPETTPEEIRQSFGVNYRAMLDEVRAAMADPGSRFPDLRGRRTVLRGLVWFQGWNDMIDKVATAEYTSSLSCFIRDVRKDFGAPKLPVVIGQMGVGGAKPDANIATFKAAEAAVMEVPEFRGNVALVKTDALWDDEAQAVFDKGWKEHQDEWNRVGSDMPYHYLGSAKTMLGIGAAFADAMLELESSRR